MHGSAVHKRGSDNLPQEASPPGQLKGESRRGEVLPCGDLLHVLEVRMPVGRCNLSISPSLGLHQTPIWSLAVSPGSRLPAFRRACSGLFTAPMLIPKYLRFRDGSSSALKLLRAETALWLSASRFRPGFLLPHATSSRHPR